MCLKAEKLRSGFWLAWGCCLEKQRWVGGRKGSQALVSVTSGDELTVHPRGRDFCCPCCWGGGDCSIGMLAPPASMPQCFWQQLAEIHQGWGTNTSEWVTSTHRCSSCCPVLEDSLLLGLGQRSRRAASRGALQCLQNSLRPPAAEQGPETGLQWVVLHLSSSRHL